MADPSDRCGGDLTAPTGHFRPLDSDGDTFFDRHLNCLWRIIAGEHTKVRLAVNDVDIKDIPYELNCSGGFLKVRRKLKNPKYRVNAKKSQ